MTHRNLFRSIAITTGAALIGLAGASAQAGVVPGNYQDHALPSATRHTVNSHQDHSRAYYARLVQANSDVRAGNYQDHVVPRATRRNADRVNVRANTGSDEVAMSESATH